MFKPLSFAILLGLAALPAAASGSDALTLQSAQVGIGGMCKAGFWTPIWLTVQAGPEGASGRLEIVIDDGDQTPVIYPASRPLDLAAGGEERVLLYARIGPIAAPITARLSDRGRVVWSQRLADLPPPLPPSRHLIVSIGPNVGLSEAIATLKGPAESAYVATSVPDGLDLPDQWWGYDGVDAVVLATSEPTPLSDPRDPRRGALGNWTRLGGKLIVSAGARGAEFFAAAGERPLAPPFTVSETTPLRDRAGLEAFGGAELPWEDDDFQRRRPAVLRITNADGVALVDEGGLASGRPLVLRSAFGLGELTLVAVDLDHPGFAKWSGRPRMIARLLQGDRAASEAAEGTTRRGVVHLGYNDLVGQLRSALDQFPGVTLVSFTTVATLTVLFLLLIGPGDYLLLSRLNLPRQTTWLTFSALAAAFGGLAWWLAGDAHGSRPRANQAEVIDVDAVSRVMRGTLWTHVYSPTATRLDLELQVEPPRSGGPLEPGGWLAWQGLPGDALGGLGSRQFSLARPDPYAILPPGATPRIASLPLVTASSKSLAARWWGSGPAVESKLAKDQYGLLSGEVTNPLDVELTDWLVAHEDRMYRLDAKLAGPLAPGQTVRIGDLSPLNLEARLTNRYVVDSKDVATQWNQASTDIPQIVRMMLFYESARGPAYTGLAHRYQSELDLTGHLRLGRAVLIGRAARPVARITAGGQPLAEAADAREYTWWRFVLPVGPQPAMPSQP
ncbi:MAG: hypothetical protein SFU86_20505 [Pirellulaceae bacterium]|nr:hypothetical protein [Pirellulaceae bacterium]